MSLLIIAHVSMTIGTRHNSKRKVPNFVGLTLSSAKHYASRRDLNIVVRDSLHVAGCPGGVILEQDQPEGVIVKPGRKIYVTINSLHQRKAAVPYVAGYSLRQAKSRLESAGFVIANIEYTEDIATNNVLEEFVNGEQVQESGDVMANVGSGVVLKVGFKPGEERTKVPNVVGLTLLEAKNKLWELGFNIGNLSFDPGITVRGRDTTRVYRQAALPAEDVQRGDYISLLLTNDMDKVHNAKESVREMLRERFVRDSIEQANKLVIDSLLNANNLSEENGSQQNLGGDELLFFE